MEINLTGDRSLRSTCPDCGRRGQECDCIPCVVCGNLTPHGDMDFVCSDCRVAEADELWEEGVLASPQRVPLPDERKSITHRFDISGYVGYITAGVYDDGTLGEIFLRMAKEGSITSGLMDSFATVTSIALQYGVPLEVLVDKFVNTRFEPSGVTNNAEIQIAKSIMDYVFRWLELKFLPGRQEKEKTNEQQDCSDRCCDSAEM